jgi:hypothetical protein
MILPKNAAGVQPALNNAQMQYARQMWYARQIAMQKAGGNAGGATGATVAGANTGVFPGATVAGAVGVAPGTAPAPGGPGLHALHLPLHGKQLPANLLPRYNPNALPKSPKAVNFFAGTPLQSSSNKGLLNSHPKVGQKS